MMVVVPYLINVAFIRGCYSFARVSQLRQHHDHMLVYDDASKAMHKTTSIYACENSSTYVEICDHLPDRRSFIAITAFGVASVLGADADAALGYDILLGDKRQHTDRMSSNLPVTVTLPLEPASGGTFCVRFTLYPPSDISDCRDIFGVHNNVEEPFRLYRAIVDTGSPYLVLPSPGSMDDVQRTPKWRSSAFACAQNRDESSWLTTSQYGPTEEIYGAVTGQVNWKLARYTFRDPLLHTMLKIDGESQRTIRPSPYAPDAVGVVGILDNALTNEATGGGVIEPYALLGLIRNSNPNADKTRFPDPRPSFLEQESLSTGPHDNNNVLEQKEYQIKSFCINGPGREIKFSTQSLISTTEPVLQLVDLRTYGDFVDHYAVLVDSLTLDGITVTSQSLMQFGRSVIEQPIVAVFDTGLTGCLIIRQFWNLLQKYKTAQNAKTSQIRSASLSPRTTGGGNLRNDFPVCKMMSHVDADSRFYVEPIDLDWFDDEQYAPYVIILGQTFLSRGTLAIDMNDRIASFNLADV